jgi:hypothetical protein
MRKLIAALVLLAFTAPSVAGLKLTALPDKATFVNGDTINFSIRVEATGTLTPLPPVSVSGIGGPIGGVNGFNFGMVGQAGSTGPTPTGPGTVTGAAPWAVLHVGTGLAFVNFTPAGSPLNAAGDSVVVGNVPFAVNDALTGGLFDLVISDFSIGTNLGDFSFAATPIGTAKVVVPLPAALPLLACALLGIGGVSARREACSRSK